MQASHYLPIPRRCAEKQRLLSRLFVLSEEHFKLTSCLVNEQGVDRKETKEKTTEVHTLWTVLKAELISHRAKHRC